MRPQSRQPSPAGRWRERPSHRLGWSVSRLLLPLAGVALVLFATAWGVGLTTDSSAYIGAARGLLLGYGIVEESPQGTWQPMLHYPPLFPLLVAAFGLVGMDPLSGARVVNALLFGANVFLVGRLIEVETGSRPTAVLGALLMLLSVGMLEPHATAWSEPTFICFGLLAVLWLGRYLARGGMGAVVAAGIAVGLAGLARYAGVELIAAGLAAIGLQRGNVARTWKPACALFAAVGATPSCLWLLRNWAVTGMFQGRTLAWHPIDGAGLWYGFGTVAGFLGVRGGPVAGALSAAALAAIVLLAVAERRRGLARLPAALGPVARTAWIFAAVHVVFLLVSHALVDAALSLSPRLLGPAYPWAVVGAVCAGYRWLRLPTSTPRTRLSLRVVAATFATALMLNAAPWVLRSHRDGMEGYASAQWRRSEILAHLRTLPADMLIYSNGAPVIRLLSGRKAAPIPEMTDPMSMAPNEHYAAEIERMRRRLREANGVVVYLDPISWVWSIPTADQLQTELGLRRVHRAADGAVYALP